MLDNLQIGEETPRVCKVESAFSRGQIERDSIVRCTRKEGPGSNVWDGSGWTEEPSSSVYYRVVSLDVAANVARVQQQQVRKNGVLWEDGSQGSLWRDDPGFSEETHELFSQSGWPRLKLVRWYSSETSNPVTKKILSQDLIVLGATVYQVERIKAGLSKVNSSTDNRDGLIDVLVIDEASQMPLQNVAPPLSILRRDGRLIVAGDPLQSTQARA